MVSTKVAKKSIFFNLVFFSYKEFYLINKWVRGKHPEYVRDHMSFFFHIFLQNFIFTISTAQKDLDIFGTFTTNKAKYFQTIEKIVKINK